MISCSSRSYRRSRVALLLTPLSVFALPSDLIQDLEDLAKLFEENAARYDTDTTFDPAGAVAQARARAAQIRDGLSSMRLTVDQSNAKQARDQANAELSFVVGALREAGRYAFRDEPATAAKFASAYLRKKRRRARAETVEDGAPSSVGAAVPTA